MFLCLPVEALFISSVTVFLVEVIWLTSAGFCPLKVVATEISLKPIKDLLEINFKTFTIWSW